MSGTGPRHRCSECKRGVLNRHVSHCLYCGAQLPPTALASADEIAAAQERMRKDREQGAATLADPARPEGKFVDKADGTLDLIGIISDLLD